MLKLEAVRKDVEETESKDQEAAEAGKTAPEGNEARVESVDEKAEAEYFELEKHFKAQFGLDEEQSPEK